MSKDDILDRLKALGVVPVIRTSNQKTAETAVEWLAEAGFETFEITLTTPGALEVIERFARQSELLIGVGTVLSIEDARRSMDAGARYIVSPCIVPGMPATTKAQDLPCMLGALTPTEVVRALGEGADAIKIFPVSSGGGASHVKALKSVFPDICLCPTGGISVENITPYFDAGADFVGVGGQLVDETALAAGDKSAVTRAAQAALMQVEQARL
jgi:2-dehydro-3-deoxyphosphogluconate aldolase/(4S)-4-hydroxy-2-oxoglutarate aldolase